MFLTKHVKGMAIFFIILFAVLCVLQFEAEARLGGSRSFGSRGSRSYSTPSPSRTSPTQPSQGSNSYNSASGQPQGSFLRSLGGGILGGVIGGMLFRSLGFGSTGGMGGGIGLFEILLIGGLLYGLYWFIKNRRQAATALPLYREAMTDLPAGPSATYQPYSGPSGMDGDLETGVGHIRQMDSTFDEQRFQDLCMDYFFKLQGAWINRDLSSVKNLLTDEMSALLQRDIDRLKADKQVNKLDNIAVRSVDLMEAWQEEGKDFITVKIYANLVDYTMDETTGQVVAGSKSDPVKFEEYWTFTRRIGDSAWQLSAIHQPS